MKLKEVEKRNSDDQANRFYNNVIQTNPEMIPKLLIELFDLHYITSN